MEGRVELYEVLDGVWTRVAEFPNNILYSGYDALAKALGGDADYIVNGMYVEFMNGSPVEPTIPLDREVSHYTSLSDPYGYVRMRTVCDPVYAGSDGDYKANMVTFTGVTKGVSSGGASVVDGTSSFFSLALAAIPDIEDASRDILVSAAPIKSGGVFAPLVKAANSQLGFRWTLKFEA